MDKQDKSVVQQCQNIDEKDKEKISLLIDGALSLDETKYLIERLKTEQPLRAYWRSLHLISDVMQDSRSIDWLSDEISVGQSYHQQTKIVLKHQSEKEVDPKKQGRC